MTKLVWDNIGERFFEAGLDRGVLYNSQNIGVPWNGLVSVNEEAGATTSPLYFSGVKYLDLPSIGDYSGTLNAFTYPDEFQEFMGVPEVKQGLYAHGQMLGRFGLSYRTKVGNDVDGIDHGYKVHLVYNLTATPAAISHTTETNLITPAPLSWSLDGVPEYAEGIRPTAHVHFDSRYTHPFLLADIEDILYGTGTYGVIDGGPAGGGGIDLNGDGVFDGGDVENNTEPRLPSLSELVALVRDWHVLEVVDNGDGTWTATSKYDGIIEYDNPGQFRINQADATYIDEDTYQIKTH